MGKGLLPAADRLIDRVNRLVQAGVDTINERDEPASPPRTPEQALFLVRDRLGKLIVERRTLERLIASLPETSADLSSKAEIAVRHGREDLARAALSEASRIECTHEALTQHLAGIDADIALLEQAVAQLSTARRPDTVTSVLLAELDRLARDVAKTDSGA